MYNGKQQSAIKEILKKQPHLVLCNPELKNWTLPENQDESIKKPASTGWQKNKPTDEEVLVHIKKGGLVGIIPWSLGAVVFDCDGDHEAKDALIKKYGPPAFICPSRKKGREHLWYRSGRAYGNGKWQGGDIRGGSGYVILWHCETIDLEALEKAEPISISAVTHDEPQPWGDQNRNNTLNKEVYQLFTMVMNEDERERRLDEIRQKAIDADLGENEINATIRSAKVAGEKQRMSLADTFGDLSRKVIVDAPHGSKKANELAFEALGIRLFMNELSWEVEVDRGSGLEKLRDSEWDYIKVEMQDRFLVCDPVLQKKTEDDARVRAIKPLRWGEGHPSFLEIISAIGEDNKINPLMDYFTSLEKNPPALSDITIYNYLTRTLGVDETPLDEYGQSVIFLGTLARVMKPGCRIRNFPVLFGRDGYGKSAMIEALLPPHLKDRLWTESFGFSNDSKRMIEGVMGRAIVELSELTGVNRAEVSRIKQFLTATKDDVRLSYGRTVSSLPRCCMFVGTSNHNTTLSLDQAAAVRFLPLECTHGSNIEKFMEEHRDSLWYQALQVWKEKGLDVLKPPTGWRNKVLERVGVYQPKNLMLQSRYDSFVENIEEFPWKYKLEELQKELCGHDVTSSALKNFLRDEGWTPRKVNGERLWINDEV